MAEKKEDSSLKLDALREQIRKPVKDFGTKLITKLGENLRSITVVGSSLTEDFKAKKSDINTVLVLSRQSLDLLKTIAGMAKSMSKKRIAAPLLMTPAYIERSRDVFGIEFLDFQLTHQTIFGEDPFAALSFAKPDVRLQCERELKATLIRLRQGYISAAGNKKLVRDILISTAKGLVPLLRAMLWLKDSNRARRAQEVFIDASGKFSIKTDCLADALKWRHEKIRLDESEIAEAFQSTYSAVELLALTVDKLEV